MRGRIIVVIVVIVIVVIVEIFIVRAVIIAIPTTKMLVEESIKPLSVVKVLHIAEERIEAFRVV